MYRYDLVDEVTYEPDPFVYVEGDPIVPRPEINKALMLDFGNKANHRIGDEPVEISVFEEGWDKIEVTAPNGETELYAPDVPAFGDTLFTRPFFEAHRSELEAARALLADDESRRIFDNVVAYKLSGDISYLLNAQNNEDEIFETIIRPHTIRAAADLGAYNGDTVRQLLEKAEGNVDAVWAMEPDARNYKKLASYAQSESRARIIPVNAGAWNEEATLFFDKSGNRNASFEQNRSQSLADRPAKVSEVKALPLDKVLGGARVDYIKYDVEGSEREALDGSLDTLTQCAPTLLVSLYHRSEDIFALPLHIRKIAPQYSGFYLRRLAGIPAWDLNLYCKK